MYKFFTICLLAIVAAVTGAPGIVAPFAYTASAPLAYTAPAVVGSAAYVAPYASSYNAHHIAHSAAYPAAPLVAAPAPVFF